MENAVVGGTLILEKQTTDIVIHFFRTRIVIALKTTLRLFTKMLTEHSFHATASIMLSLDFSVYKQQLEERWETFIWILNHQLKHYRYYQIH